MRLGNFGETLKFNLCVKVTFLLCELVQQTTLADSLETRRIYCMLKIKIHVNTKTKHKASASPSMSTSLNNELAQK